MPIRPRRVQARRDAARSATQPNTLGADLSADAFRFHDFFRLTRRADGPTLPSAPRVRRFLSYYRPHIPLLLADLACAVIVAMTALALPLCAHQVTQKLATLHNAPAALAAIYSVGGLMLALLAAQAVSTLFVDYQGHVMGAKMESALRRDVFEHCQKLSFSFYDRQRVGQLMSRITNDLFSLGELYHHGPEDLAIAVLKFAGAVAILAWLDGPLTLMILAVVPFAVGYALHFSGRMNAALKRSKVQIGAINERVEDSLAGIRVVQSFVNEDLENRRFEAENAKFLESRRAGYRSEAFFSMGTTTFPQLITVAVIVAGALRVTQAKLGVGDMLTFLLCVAVLVDPVERLANFVRLWQQGYTGVRPGDGDPRDRAGHPGPGRRGDAWTGPRRDQLSQRRFPL